VSVFIPYLYVSAFFVTDYHLHFYKNISVMMHFVNVEILFWGYIFDFEINEYLNDSIVTVTFHLFMTEILI